MDTDVAPARAAREPRVPVRGDDRWIVAIGLLVLLPLVVTLLGLVGVRWFPASDQALEVLRIGDVGGRHTPLVGVQSRFGWDHPGPLLFWSLAPFRWVLGNTGVLVGVGVLNAAAIIGALLVARRRGGLPFVVAFAVVFLLLLQGNDVELLIDPWNPWVAVMPFLCYVLLVWSLAERDLPLLPWLVVVGTFLVQAHVGYAPFVIGLAVVAALVAWRGHVRDADVPAVTTVRRDVLRAAVVGVVLWLPALIDQVFGDGNLGDLVDFFRHPTERTAGWVTSLQVMANEMRLPGAWITGDDFGPFGIGLSRNAFWPALVLGGAALLGLLAFVRGARGMGAGAARLAAIGLAAAAAGLVAGSRIVGLLGPYLVRWWWVIVAALWLSILWSAWTLLARTRAVPVVTVLAAVAVVVLSLAGVRDGLRADVPFEPESDAIAALAPQVAAALDEDATYLVSWIESRTWAATAIGAYLELYDRGFDVRVPPVFEHSWGARRTATDDEVDANIIVVADEELALGWNPPDGATVIAHYDPLTQQERARATQLDAQLRAVLDVAQRNEIISIGNPYTREDLRRRGADPDAVEEYRELTERGQAYTVFLAPMMPVAADER